MSSGKYGLLSCAFFPALLYMFLKCRGDNWGNNAGIGFGEDGCPTSLNVGERAARSQDLLVFSCFHSLTPSRGYNKLATVSIHAPREFFRLYCSSN
jgi:hypothetical protein